MYGENIIMLRIVYNIISIFFTFFKSRNEIIMGVACVPGSPNSPVDLGRLNKPLDLEMCLLSKSKKTEEISI